VIEDKGFREQLIARGRENVKRFDPERIARQYLEVYRTLAR
jgi:glycosyltransferase involved in cell wall biosynthesis